jgi:hypothetical protein
MNYLVIIEVDFNDADYSRSTLILNEEDFEIFKKCLELFLKGFDFYLSYIYVYRGSWDEATHWDFGNYLQEEDFSRLLDEFTKEEIDQMVKIWDLVPYFDNEGPGGEGFPNRITQVYYVTTPDENYTDLWKHERLY